MLGVIHNETTRLAAQWMGFADVQTYTTVWALPDSIGGSSIVCRNNEV